MRTPNVQRIQNTLNYIIEYYNVNDRMPSFRTIKDACNYKSMNTLFADIERLKEQHALTVDKENHLRLPMSEKSRRRSATLVGGIRCGTPTDATVEDPETVELPAVLFGEDINRVIMKAEGDSMIGLGIHDGDWLIVKKQPTANVGDVVAAMLSNGEYIYRIFQRNEEGYYLDTANPDYKPIWPSEDWFIYGVVQHVIHKV